MSSGHSYGKLFEGQAHLYKLLYSYFTPMCVKWATELGIPTIIHNHGKPITLPHLLSALNLPSSKTWVVPRFMRFLVHNGLFAIVSVVGDNDNGEEEEKEAYALTPASELLVEGNNKHCFTPIVKSFLDYEFIGKGLGRIGEWTRGEESSVIETALGVRFWDLIHHNPEKMSVFNEAMASDSQMVSLALRDCKSVFEGIESIVDVGGGNGATGKIICEAFTELQYTVFDLPPVVANLNRIGNLSYLGGDMFESIPQADAVLLKWVLHDWNDEDCIKILKNCKKVISEKGKVIIIDTVIHNKELDKDKMTSIKLLYDISMTVMFGAKERSEEEWKQLFIEAGFNNYKIFPIFGFRSLIEVHP